MNPGSANDAGRLDEIVVLGVADSPRFGDATSLPAALSAIGADEPAATIDGST